MGRREILNGFFLAIAGLGGAAIVAGLTTPATHWTPLLIWGGLAVCAASALGLALLFLTTVKQPEAEADREYLPAGLTPEVLVEKTRGRTSLQVKAITHTYKGKWAIIEGQVRDVESHFGTISLSIDVPDQRPICYGYFSKSHHERLGALNLGDWVTIEGPISGIQHGVVLDPATLLHVGKTPVPSS